MSESPAKLRSGLGEEAKYKEFDTQDESQVKSRRSSANRILTVFKAALNYAYNESENIISDSAWRRVKPFQGVETARPHYLEQDESVRLINACHGNFKNLVQAALMTGARYGELSKLTVRDFDTDSKSVFIEVSKSGKSRNIALTEEGIEFFENITAGRPSEDHLFHKDNRNRWGKSHQDRPMKEACKAGGIEPAISINALRHTYATLSLKNGMTLMVLARNLGHSDTRMVERHYGHLTQGYIAEEVRKGAPTFGTVEKSNIEKLNLKRG